MLKKLICFLFIVSFCAPLFSQVEYGRNIVKTLCDSSFHGRGYVNGGDKIAAKFIASEFAKLGVKPYKSKQNKSKEYCQKFIMSVNSFPKEVSCIVNGQKLITGIDFIVHAGSASIHSSLTPLLLQKKDFDDLEKFPIYIKSKMETGKYNAFTLDFEGISKDSLKIVKGIANELNTLLPVIELTDEKFTWTVDQQQLPNAYIYLQKNKYPRNDLGVEITNGSGNDNANETEIVLNIDALAIEYYSSQNVIAYIKSKKKSKKTVVFTAHYDHLGRMGADTYFPGGNDNASGTAMLLSMAKYFTENPPDFNVLFIAFAGEEAGLLGSKFYTENPTFPLEKMTFLFNLDIMGSGEDGVTIVNATLFEKQFELLQEINKEENLLTVIKSRGPAANSDHYFFTEKGVPAFFMYTSGPNRHYHDVGDTYENLSFSEFADIQKLLVEFAKRL